MIREQILELASQSPEFGQGIDIIEERLSRTAMVPEDLDEAIEMLEAALENPAMYAEMVQAAIADGLIDEGDAPAEFDAVFIISILMALYGLQERGMAQGYARGGLTVAGRRLANQGQGGDSMLAHINPREAEVLRRMGGQGTVNPNTGLAEYKSLKKTLKVVLPVALMVFGGPLGAAVGKGIGLTGTAATVAGSAILGAGSAALTGGDPLRGAIMGGITGGIGNVAGNAINQGMNLGLSAPMAATLGSGLVGGAAGVVSGDGFKQGALQGAGGQLLKNFAGTGSGTGAPNAFQGAIQSGVDATGNMLTAGYTPRESLQGGATAGLFSAGKSLLSGPKPSTAVVNGIKQTGQAGAPLVDANGVPIPGQVPEGTTFGDIMAAKQNEFINMNSNDPFAAGLDPSANFATGNISADLQQPYFDMQNRTMPSTPGMFDGARNWIGDNKMAAGMLGLGAMGMMESETPVDVVDAVSAMSPEQQEYFNRPQVSWDWNAVRQDANRANLSLTEFMAQNFNNLTSGQYNMQASGYNRGGALRAASYVSGGGTGRSDEIPAYLSDGEYVVDAETVSMLGDGSSKAGAEALNGMREGIRSHKGKVLAKGQFSPNAKSPLTYLRQGMA